MKVVIMAGGGGTRLFPLSRSAFPKQFLNLNGDLSLLAQTVKRFQPVVAAEDMLVVANAEHVHLVRNELATVQATGAKILLEPVGRNTAPAIALAASYCKSELGALEDEVLFITPADHVIGDGEYFADMAVRGMELAGKGYLVTFGIKPVKPETGYGYIQIGQPLEHGYGVKAFKEKPDVKTAEAYVASGQYFWNSGMFAMSLGTLRQELALHAPEIYRIMDQSFDNVLEQFPEMPSISIDYAVAEKSERVAMLPFLGDWNDVGSWDAIYDLIDKDKNENAIIGDCVIEDCAKSLFMGQNRMIAAVGLEDVLVAETDDVILVAHRGKSQQVKSVVENLKKQGRREALEHRTMHRPWGSYTILNEGPGYKLKKVTVKPGGCLSLQMHYHRSEHWIVIGGTAQVTLGDQVRMVHTNESIFVPATTKHRLENPGRIPLHIIEVQNGAYLEEDDIVRYDDQYGRC